ncbi:MAG: putative lipid II flippase FtsW, partial [Thermoleophilaceae bacterium]|nr:putative lipid II flippase FtsW [Thermoleophilaceae bacterium]
MAKKPPLEYSILYTATLCLLAAGAVMVYSASSAESLLDGPGDASHYLKRYLLFAALGLVALHALSRVGLKGLRQATPIILTVAFGLTVAVMVPGIGREVNGASRWLGAGPLVFQPSELLKIALILYAVTVLSRRGKLQLKPILIVTGVACTLLMVQPDMGTSIVVCMSMAALLIAAGIPLKTLGKILGILFVLALIVALIEPYRRARMTAFIDPWADASGDGFQTVQSMIAVGSGGVFGHGLGESVQKIFYLPEAHTDMILAIIGEEVGLIGIIAVAALYAFLGYAGLRAAKAARDRYGKLLAAGLTSLLMSQATLNLFAVLGMAPLTGVPLPFISYGGTNLIVLLGAMGLVLNVAKTPLRGIDGGRKRDPR